MTSDSYMLIGLVAFFGTHVLNRFLTERNYKTLSSEDKMKLFEGFSTHRSLATYVPISILLPVVMIANNFPQHRVILFGIGFVLVLVVSIALTFAILRRLAERELPADYIQRFRTHCLAVQFGNILAMSMFFVGLTAR